jgi:S-adenosylmethionine synthetase
VEAWTKVEGKERYRSYFQVKTQVKDAIKEIKKVLTCKAVSIYLKILKFNTQNILSVEF